jgi:hypothetical protein
MREFFRGWKRKVGVVTMTMACLFMAGWLRSRHARDEFNVGRNHGLRITGISGRSHFSIGIIKKNGFTDPLWLSASHNETDSTLDVTKPIDGARCPTVFHIHMGLPRNGITLGESRFNFYHETSETCWFAGFWLPYWSIVIPLTAISAWLLLSKPRPAKPPVIETTE